MKREMRSAKKCLVASIILFLPGLLNAQEYISGYGSSPREAINDMSMRYVQVSTHSVHEIHPSGEEYHSISGVDSGIVFPRDSVTLILHDDDIWEARIDKSLVKPAGSEWVEQNIIINNTTNYIPYQERGYQVSRSNTVSDRKQYVVSPRGKRTVTASTRTTIDTKKRWNGKFGSTVTTTRRYKQQ